MLAHVRREGPEHSLLVLDTRDLTINSVCDQSGDPLEHAMGEPHVVFGSALTVTLKESTSRVEIKYRTSPDAVAIQVPCFTCRMWYVMAAVRVIRL